MAVARIAPHLAVGGLRLFVGRGKESAVVFLCQSLPVEIKSASLTGFAGALAAPVLMNDDTAKGSNALRNPNGVLDRENQFTRLVRGFKTNPVVGWCDVGGIVVGRLLGGTSCRSE